MQDFLRFLPYRGDGDQRSRCAVKGRDQLLEDADIVPCARLVAHLGLTTDGSEAHGGVEGIALFVGLGDNGVCAVHTLQEKHFFQRNIQSASDTLAVTCPIHIDGQLRAPAVGGAFTVTVGIGVADDASILLADQIRVCEKRIPYAGGEFRFIGQLIFKGDGCVDVLGVDPEQCGGIRFTGKSQCNRGFSLCVRALS